jgi:hypothetical protein
MGRDRDNPQVTYGDASSEGGGEVAEALGVGALRDADAATGYSIRALDAFAAAGEVDAKA